MLGLTAGLTMSRGQDVPAYAYLAWAQNGALLASAFLSLNYFFQGGTNVPWINPNGAFTQGVDITILIPLISITLFAAHAYGLVAAGNGALRVRRLLPPRADGSRSTERGPETLGSHLEQTLNDATAWVDGYGVCWTGRDLLHAATERRARRSCWPVRPPIAASRSEFGMTGPGLSPRSPNASSNASTRARRVGNITEDAVWGWPSCVPWSSRARDESTSIRDPIEAPRLLSRYLFPAVNHYARFEYCPGFHARSA